MRGREDVRVSNVPLVFASPDVGAAIGRRHWSLVRSFPFGEAQGARDQDPSGAEFSEGSL